MRSLPDKVLAGAIAIALAVSACASVTGHPVLFNGEQTGYRTEDTPAVFVLPHSASLEHTLDLDARSTVQRALGKMGYSMAGEEKAGVFLIVEAWIDTRVQSSMASMFRPATVDIVREPDGTTRTVRRPERALSVPVTVQHYFPRMTMVAIDAPLFRQSGETRILWRGDTLMQNGNISLADALPYLLTPLLTSFGTQSRGPIKVEVTRQTAMEFK